MAEPFLFSLNGRKARNEFSLNGTWAFQPGRKGEKPATFSAAIPVPGLVDLAEPQHEWSANEFHWYRTDFKLTADEMPPLAFLKIGQAQFGTAVWLNGKETGSSISCYTSQEYRIDPALRDGLNELLIRVGAKRALPPESAVGKDQERERYIPGIWGDVSLIVCGNPRINHVQIIPHISKAVAEVRVTLENVTSAPKKVSLSLTVLEKKSGNNALKPIKQTVEALALQPTPTTVSVPIENMQLWSPESPFLYVLETSVVSDGAESDVVRTTFGMREFEVKGKGFYLNGKRVFLKGGNIAFHRFLSDPERKLLPWNSEWIKRALIDIPKEHNFNFFRNHLGQMYPLWYDLADEYGMLVQNEWHFWGATGSKEQITKEFTEWIRDNCNHPSIVIWDALNESTDEVVQKEIVPVVRQLDPTRPWESVDFVEEHPYIYSLGPVLNDRTFGFTRALKEIEKSTTSTVLNEFGWWWLNSAGKPTSLMKGVTERWLGPEYTKKELLEHQAFLARELVELFRRMRVDAIQPFVYLSNNDGPTAHWFLGPIVDLQPKPILGALKNAFSSFGVSVELWDRHFFAGEARTITIWVFNDEPTQKEGTVHYGVADTNGAWIWNKQVPVTVEGAGAAQLPLVIALPSIAGSYIVQTELLDRQSNVLTSVSHRLAHVFDPVQDTLKFADLSVVALENGREYGAFLHTFGASVVDVASHPLTNVEVVVVGEGMVQRERYIGLIEDLSPYVNDGGVLVLIEPELGIRTKSVVPVLRDLDLVIEPRQDTDRGGYDSYVFPTDFKHTLWRDLHKEHLKMFNGGYGGEVVSEHNVVPTCDFHTLARCGLGLAIPAVMEIAYGKGKVIISRLQTRGRLFPNQPSTDLHARRVDPVLQRYMMNLISYAIGSSTTTPVLAAKGA